MSDQLIGYYVLRSILSILWTVLLLGITWYVYRALRKAKVTRQQAIRFHLIVGMWSWIFAGTMMIMIADGTSCLIWNDNEPDEFGAPQLVVQRESSWNQLNPISRLATRAYVWIVPSSVIVIGEPDGRGTRPVVHAWGFFIWGACYFMGAFLLHMGMYLPPKATYGLPIVDSASPSPKQELS